MDFVPFVRKAFIVEAVEVTLENIEEIAKLVGEIRYENEKPYIHVNPNVVVGVRRAFPGYWMTRMGDNLRLYNKRVFFKMFCPNTPEIESWVDYINNQKEPEIGEYGRIIEPAVPEANVVEPVVGAIIVEEPVIEVTVNAPAEQPEL
jgi:hypothetical protein